MDDKFLLRLSKSEKNEIAQNLIDILQKNVDIENHTRSFISNWILSGPEEKTKAYYDVWDMVLKNYLPEERLILFRSCNRISKKTKIASFTGRLECANAFNNGKGVLIICDTQETLRYEEEFRNVGNYRNTFYPIVSVLKKAKKSEGWGFSERILNEFIGEDEYIMKFDPNTMHSLRWINNVN